MSRVFGLAVLVVVLCVPAIASEPGEPLDCSDWVIVEPGYYCETLVPPPCDDDTSRFCSNPFSGVTLDNEGRTINVFQGGTGVFCGPLEMTRYALWAYNEHSETLIAYIEDRCADTGLQRADLTRVPFGSFDEENGRWVTRMGSDCYDALNPPDCAYPYQASIVALTGFATTFEILQTYTPTTNQIGLSVPYLPEGFQSADWFDTYWGDLATVGDWSQAQPLQCGYPATAPNVGDYLTVEDTLPTPTPGRGYYYVTAVNYQGQRRYGRQSNGGVLSGRDPAVLPTCE